MKKTILFIIALLLMLPSCAPGMPNDEAITAIQELVEKSLPLNNILYGEGLMPDMARTSGVYAYALPSEYDSIDKIKQDLAEIFTPEYCEILYRSAFQGLAEGDISYALIAEDENGLKIYIDRDVYLKEEREYDFSTLKITRNREKEIRAKVDTTKDGERLSVEIKMKKINDVWLLDSPTY
jgi:hypothetical protein